MRYKIDNIRNHQDRRGWICGHFFPENDLLRSNLIEAKYSTINPGETIQKHHHPKGEDVLIIIKGELKIVLDGDTHTLKDGDFVIQKANTQESIIEVLKPTSYIAIRSPSIPNNKVKG